MSTVRSSVEVLGELMALRDEPSPHQRLLRAWQLINQAAGNSDFPVVVDYAVEQRLIVGADEARARVRATTWINPIDESEMVWIPAGPFCVGPKKQHAKCRGFSLARFPVTNAQFRTFVQATAYRPPESHPENNLFLSHWSPNGAVPRGLDSHPVVWVSYIDALAYCAWTGFTLPTEWLWEKAARGEDGRSFPWGDARPNNQLANVRSSGTTPVNQFPRTRTPHGCEDLVGNVSEWCQTVTGSDFGYMPEGPPLISADLSASAHTVVRGCCYLRNNPRIMVAWHARRLSMTRRNYWTGFRCAYLHPWQPGR